MGRAAWHAFDSEQINTYWININDDDDYKYAYDVQHIFRRVATCPGDTIG